MNFYQKIVAYLQLREAVSMADSAHQKDGHRYYVMPVESSARKQKPKLIVIDRRNFRILKHKGYISTNAKVRDLIDECFYFTPYRAGSAFITSELRKRKTLQFFRWYNLAAK